MIWKKHSTISLENRMIHLCYFVTSPIELQDLDLPCYGIGVSDGEDIAFDHAFSSDKEEAIRVAEMLYQNGVTPATFMGILESYFDAVTSVPEKTMFLRL